MTQTVYPDNYLTFNTQQTKKLVLVISIEGVPGYFSLAQIYTRVRYGDPGIVYGEPGLVYGALKRRDDVKPYLTLDGSLTVSQRLEPEQGRASISTFTLVFIDKDGYLTQLVSPGIIVDELMGDREVKIYLGFQDTSFPDDFFVVFRGNVSSTEIVGEKVTLGLTDPNQRRRQDVFNVATMQTTASLDTSQTTVFVDSTVLMYSKVLGPDGTYDPSVNIFVKIDDEYMKVTAVAANQMTVVRNTAPVGITTSILEAHDSDTTVAPALQLGTDDTTPFGEHAITLALKIMLSGWGGPYMTGVTFLALGRTLDVLNPITNVVYLVADAVEDYGLAIGDYITVSGSTAGNNGTYKITDIQNDITDHANRLVSIDTNLTPENYASPTALAFRSQFDTLPDAAGLQLRPTEVDVAGHLALRDLFFTGTENYMQFEIESSSSGKEFIESQLFLPIGAYSLTRYGRLSVGYTRPPIPGDTLITLDSTNVIKPEQIRWTRSLNSRRFYNEIDYDYEQVDGGLLIAKKFLDENSNATFGQSSALPISATGVRDALGGGLLALKRSTALLTRYKLAAIEISLTVQWSVGSLIEVGDVVVINDNGGLQIPNIANGTRNLGNQLYEVINRSLDVKSGTASLTLLGGIFDSRQDRYGTIAPSSLIAATGTTTTQLQIKPSFGQKFGVNEFQKWTSYVGMKLSVHDITFTHRQDVLLDSVSTAVQNLLILDPGTPLSFLPGEDYIVDLAEYSTSTDPDDQKYSKLINAFLSPAVPVVTGVSSTSFNVSSGNAAKFIPGAVVMVHNVSYGAQSPEVKVLSVVGTLVTVDKTLGFTPNSSHTVEFIGFADSQGAYRIL